MKKGFISGCALALAASLQMSCTQVVGERVGHAADSEMGAAIKDLRKASRGDFREVAYASNSAVTARAFIAAAQNGDLDGMMGMTSAITLKNDGASRTRNSIYPSVIRGLAGAKIEWPGRPTPMTDETGNPGFIVPGVAVKNGRTPFHVVVTREQGRHVVISIRK